MNLQNFIIISVIAILSFQLSAQQSISGVEIRSEIINSENQVLALNGVGLREKFWIDLYIASLYVETKALDAELYYTNSESLIMDLNIISNLITSEKMISAIKIGFEKSVESPTTELKAKISNMTSLLKSNTINKGDQIMFSYVQGKGTYIIKNNKVLSLIPGKDFKSALFGIWLCNKPADKNLKKALLNGN